jgi:hypothetical protein
MVEGEARDVGQVVLTNVSAPWADGAPVLDPEVLWYRLGFFYDACLPSVSGQRDAEFTWLVWFDDRCEPDVREEVERISAGVFTPVWGHRLFDAESVAEAVAARTHSPYLITTIVDWDEAMARNCLATVRAESAHLDRLLVVFPEGVMVDRTGGVFAAHDDRGSLRSLIEVRVNGSLPTTVVGVTDQDEIPQRRISEPMWIDVVHEVGRAELITTRRLDPAIIDELFDVDLAYDRTLSGARLRKARRGDLRRRGRNLMRDPKQGARITPVLRSVRAASWLGRSAVNSAVDRRDRRRGTAGLRPVAGDPEAVVANDRLAVLAEFSGEDQVRPWALVMAKALAAAGYPCLVVCSRDRGRAVTEPEDLPDDVAVASRVNVNYDFGAWAAALEAYPGIAERAHVLLVNDSIIGPLPPDSPGLQAALQRGEASGAHVWAATRSLTGSDHLESYFLTFHDGALGLPPVRDFFRGLPRTLDRTDMVRTYEHGFSKALAAGSIRMGWAWDHTSFGFGPNVNPCMSWPQLLDAGFPFVKRRLLTHPRYADQRRLIIDHLQDRYGVDLSSGL